MEDRMKLVEPFCSEKNKAVDPEAKYLQQKVDEIEDQEKQCSSQFRKQQNVCANYKRSSCY